MQWWFKKCWKGDKSLEDEEQRGQPLEVDNGQLRGSLKLILLELQEKLLKNSALTILQSFGVWSKLERWKSSISGCLLSQLKIKRIIVWSVVFFYSLQQQQTISRSDCDVQWRVDFIRKPEMISSVVGLRRSSKALPKAKFAPPKESWLLFGGLLPVWSTTANPSKTITSEKYARQMDEMHQKPQQLHSALVNRKGLILFQDNAALHIEQPTL